MSNAGAIRSMPASARRTLSTLAWSLAWMLCAQAAFADARNLELARQGREAAKSPSLGSVDKPASLRPQRVSLSEPLNGDPARGKQLAMDAVKGFCWACHALPGHPQPGSVGPTLHGFKARGYTNGQVYQQIYDARVINGATLMPPYGSSGTLSEQEIRDLTAFLQNIQ